MDNRFLITDIKIVNEGKITEGSLLIEGEKISGIYPKGNEGESFLDLQDIVLIDGRNKLLLPGIIDDHVHFREPGLTAKGDLSSESKAAVAGGVTSFMDMPNTIPPATTIRNIEEKFSLARSKSIVNYSFFLGATNDNLDEIEKADPAKICGVKVFLGSSTGNMLVNDRETLEKIFRRSPLLIVIHSEDEEIIRKNLQEYRDKYGDDIPVSFHPFIRSEEACFKATSWAVDLARKYDSRVHLCHISTEKELALFDNSLPLKRKKITSEVCLNHLWFDEDSYQSLGTRIKMNPAIKTAKDKKALLAGLLDDRIDVIATDHAPHMAEEKAKPYTQAPSGAPSIQHSLVAMLDLWHDGKIPIEKVAEKMCHSPAVLYKIKKRGFIREDYYADLVIVDPDSPWNVEKSNILYKCGWSPFEGQTFRSKITHTFVNGRLVYRNGNIDEKVKGKRLEFEKK